ATALLESAGGQEERAGRKTTSSQARDGILASVGTFLNNMFGGALLTSGSFPMMASAGF
ncbi:unnamed protein product, partial [Amoebophrya sp. A120]